MNSDDSFTDIILTGNLAEACVRLTATTITDAVTGREYGIFAGGYSGGIYFSTINAISITNGSFDKLITGKLSKARRSLTASTITDTITGI